MRLNRFLCAFVTFVVMSSGMLWASSQSLFSGGGAAVPLIEVSARAGSLMGSSSSQRASGASLFAGTEGGSLFAFAPRDLMQPIDTSDVARLRSLIASAEAGKAGYDAVQYGATVRPSKRPTQMTIAEIYAWIDDTPGQPHAIGRYQFIPPTLRTLVNELGLSGNSRFSPRVQDALADRLLEDAGLSRFAAGEMNQTAFMNNLAKIWAGLPNSSGKSHYEGYAGNKAVFTWAHFQAEMDKIFPRG